MAKHRRRAGRPRKDGARRRATTAAARPPADLCTIELIFRKPYTVNGAAEPVEIIDIGGTCTRMS